MVKQHAKAMADREEAYAEELRLLEYGVRLTARRRNALAAPGQSTGRTLFEAALAGGAQALKQPATGLAPGQRADFVELDTDNPHLTGRSADALLDSWIFCGDKGCVRSVHVGGQAQVTAGRARARESALAAYRTASMPMRFSFRLTPFTGSGTHPDQAIPARATQEE